MSCCAGDAGGFVGGVLAGLGTCMSCCEGDGGWFAAGELAGFGSDEPFAGVAGEGITIPGVCPSWFGAAGTPIVLIGTFAAGFLLTIRLGFRFGAALGFGFGLLMFGML